MQGNDAEAEALSSRAVVIMEAALGPEHHFVGITLQHLAGLLQAQVRLEVLPPVLSSCRMREYLKTTGMTVYVVDIMCCDF